VPTFQTILARARAPLNDADAVRYPDSDLIVGANKAMRVLRIRRPDLFFGSYDTALADYVASDDFPLDPEFASPVEDYITAWAQVRDDEAALASRATAFFKMFGEQL
jgi:hypothetical protein